MTLAMKATLYFSPSERCSAPPTRRKEELTSPTCIVSALWWRLSLPFATVAAGGAKDWQVHIPNCWTSELIQEYCWALFIRNVHFFVNFLLTHLTTGVLVKCISGLQMLAYYHKNHIFFLLRYTCCALCAAVMHGRHNINKVLLPWEVHKPFSSVLSFVF